MGKRKTKTLHAFVKENREKIDEVVHRLLPKAKLTDEGRRQWVSNHEELIQLARSQGVRGI